MRPHSRSVVVFTITALVASPSGGAQTPDSTALPRIVITATRSESRIGSEVATTHVLDGKTLRESGVRDIAEALRFVPGLFVARSGSHGAQSSLFLRGGESDYVRLLVDGVAMNEPGGALDLASYTLDDVERIEIVRGPSSVLYGTDAMTGVIQIFTRRPRAGRHVEAMAGGGSWGTRIGSLSSGVADGSWSATAGATRRRSDGILAFNNAYRNDVLSGRVAWQGDGGKQASFAARQFSDSYHYPTDGAGNVVDRNAWRADRRSSLVFDAAQPIGRWGRALLAVTALNARGRTDDARDGPADTLGLHTYRSRGTVRRRAADARVELLTIPHSIISLGAEWSLEAQRSRDSSNFATAPNTFDAQRDNRAAYAQWVSDAGRLQLQLGGRYDDNEVFGVFRTARAGASARLWTGGQLRGSAGGAFKAPTFLEQFNTAFTVGNRELMPERSRNVELGYRQNFRRARVGVTWFDQRFRNLIQYTYLSPERPNFFNVAAASSRGLEVDASVRGSIFELNGTGTLLRTRVDDAGFDSGDGATFVQGRRLLRRPSRTFTLGVTAHPASRLQTTLSAIRIGNREDLDFSGFPASAVVLSGYTRVDAAVQFQLVDEGARGALTLLLRADNLTGETYEEVNGFRAPGRGLFVGLRAAASR